MRDIRVCILGPIDVTVCGRPVAISGRRERAVVALLLVHAGRVVPFERMSEQLWDGDPPPSAVSSLRAHVSRVRKALAAHGAAELVATRDAGYVIDVDEISLDSDDFVDRAQEGRALLAEGAPEAAADRFRAALALWRGEPFGELGSNRFAQPEVARLEGVYWATIEDRLTADLMAGRHREITAELEALVAEQPLRERLWSLRMVALYRSGRQADALRAYGELREMLADSLGILPSPDLQELELAMLRQDLDLDPRPGAAPAPAPSSKDTAPAASLPPELAVVARQVPFVGRTEALESLHQTWLGAVDDAAASVFIAGEPGMGKTALAAQIAERANRSGGAVLLGSCDRELLTPYQPIVEALRRFVKCLPAPCLDRLARADRHELARLVPELADRSDQRTASGDGDRFGLFDAVSTFLSAAAAERPILLVLEDLQWADKPTCLLLRHLVRRCGGSRIMIVGTYRTVELTPDNPLAETLADLRRDQSVSRIHLTGLDETDVAALIEALVGDDMGAAAQPVADQLRLSTGGNPFFVKELVRHLQRSSMPPPAWGEAILTGAAGLPESIREVIGQRVNALSSGAAGALGVAAVVGDEFDVRTLEEVNAASRSKLLDLLDEAVSAGLIAESHRAPGWYEFTHTVIREVIYGSLSTLRRLRLHRSVGEALERRTGADAPSSQTLARHFIEAGPQGDAPQRAIVHCAAASQVAMSTFAYEESAALLESALEVQSLSDHSDPAQRIDLLIDLGQARWRAGSALMEPTFEEAAAAADQIGDPVRFARAVVGMGLIDGGFASSIRANETLIEHLEAAIARLGSADSELRVRLLSRLAIERYFTPRRVEGRALAEEARAMAESLGSPSMQLVATHALAWATHAPSTPPAERLARVSEVMALAAELGDREMAYRGDVLRLQTLLELGNLAGVDATISRMDQLVTELRMPRLQPWVRSFQATRAFLAGDLTKADELAAAALDMAVEMGIDTEAALALIGGQQMAVRIHRDGLEPFAHAIEAMVQELPGQAVVGAMLPVLHRELGRTNETLRTYEAAVANRDAVPRDATWLVYAWAVGVTCRDGHGEGTAEALYTELVPFADRWAAATPSICFGPIAQALAVHASVLGRHDTALRHIDAALAEARRVRVPVFEAAALVERAEILLARGGSDDRDRAHRSLDDGALVATSLGLHALVARIERLESSLR